MGKTCKSIEKAFARDLKEVRSKETIRIVREEAHVGDLKIMRGEQLIKIATKNKQYAAYKKRPRLRHSKIEDFEFELGELESFLKYLNEEIEYYEKNQN